MEAAVKIIHDIESGKIAPVYLLMGEEDYYIDKVSRFIEDKMLPEQDKGFNQTVVYGRDTTVDDLVSLAKQYPMMADRQLILVKEAQALNRVFDQFENYLKNPMPTTVLVLCYKHGSLDKRKKAFKLIQNVGVVLESPRLYDNQVAPWIDRALKSKGYQIEPKALILLVDSLGNDLSRISNELEKLTITIAPGGIITAKDIEENIGISKDFNIFELRNAIGQKNRLKAYQIVKYFAENPKENPMVLTTSMVYQYFVQLLKYHGAKDKKKALMEMGVKPFFQKDYETAAANFPMRKVSGIVNKLRIIDAKSKGIHSRIEHRDLLKEMLIGIFE